MGKTSQAEVADLKAALKILNDLQTELGHSGSAPKLAAGAKPISGAIGALIDNSGTHVGTYVDARTTAITTALNTAGGGLGTAIANLQISIMNIERNEKTHKDAADATGNGGGGTNTGRGKG